MLCIRNYGMLVLVPLSPFHVKGSEFITFHRVIWNRYVRALSLSTGSQWVELVTASFGMMFYLIMSETNFELYKQLPFNTNSCSQWTTYTMKRYIVSSKGRDDSPLLQV